LNKLHGFYRADCTESVEQIARVLSRKLHGAGEVAVTNPENSVLIVTIDENEYLHPGLLLEQMFP